MGSAFYFIRLNLSVLQKEDLVSVNDNNGDRCMIEVTDENGEMVFENDLSNDFSISKEINVSKLKADDYNAVQETGDQAYNYKFHL